MFLLRHTKAQCPRPLLLVNDKRYDCKDNENQTSQKPEDLVGKNNRASHRMYMSFDIVDNSGMWGRRRLRNGFLFLFINGFRRLFGCYRPPYKLRGQ